MTNHIGRCPACGLVGIQSQMSEEQSAVLADLMFAGSVRRMNWRFWCFFCPECNLPYALVWPFETEKIDVLTTITAHVETMPTLSEGGPQ